MWSNKKTVVVVALVIILAVGLPVGLALSVYLLMAGKPSASSVPAAQKVQYDSSYISVNEADGSGVVHLEIVNLGPDALEIQSIVLNSKSSDNNNGTYKINFAYYAGFNEGQPFVNDYCFYCATNSTWSGTPGVRFNHVADGAEGLATMVVPAGGKVSLTLMFYGTSLGNIAKLFSPGTTYNGYIQQFSGPDIPIRVPAKA